MRASDTKHAGSPQRELGDFLRTMRSKLDARSLGLPDTGSLRRVLGLRREEVAQLASISTDYYTRLEQGRIAASEPVLEAIARALHLTEDQRLYLHELAAKHDRHSEGAPEEPRSEMRRLLDHIVGIPAMVQNRRFDILAWNRLAAALMLDFEKVPPARRNFVRLVFTEPSMRTLYADWRAVGELCVALLRMEAAQQPTDQRLGALVDDLSHESPEFRAWWSAHVVARKGAGTEIYDHPRVGEIAL